MAAEYESSASGKDSCVAPDCSEMIAAVEEMVKSVPSKAVSLHQQSQLLMKSVQLEEHKKAFSILLTNQRIESYHIHERKNTVLISSTKV